MLGKLLAESIRFALCLAIVIVGCYCMFVVSTWFQEINDKLEYQYYEMMHR